jgi:hypothetical protein
LLATLRQRQFFHVQHSVAQRILARWIGTRRIVALRPIGQYPADEGIPSLPISPVLCPLRSLRDLGTAGIRLAQSLFSRLSPETAGYISEDPSNINTAWIVL